MRAEPSRVLLTRLHKRLVNLYAFSVFDVAKILGHSVRNARRYIARMSQLGVLEFKYRGKAGIYYYKVKKWN